MLKLPGNEARGCFVFVLLFAAFLAAICWYSISAFSYDDYLRICHANYANTPEFARCMHPYWDQYATDKPLFILSTISFAVSAILLLGLEIKKRLNGLTKTTFRI